MLLLLGENLSLGDLIQGTMRARGFLKKQKVVWGVLKALAAQIEEELKSPARQRALCLDLKK